jgi:hypothetical protein
MILPLRPVLAGLPAHPISNCGTLLSSPPGACGGGSARMYITVAESLGGLPLRQWEDQKCPCTIGFP